MQRIGINLYTFVFLILATIAVSAQQLTYTRLTSGLGVPEFEGGRTDFRIDDINMDGNPDILTIGDHGSPYINTDQHGICVWFGDGQGNFENFMFGNLGYGGIAVGDVNNDGFKDVGYGMHHNYSSTDLGDQILEVALGDGTGMNWTAWDDGLAANGETWGMFGTDFGDVDNDGDLDLVSISFGSGAGLHVYLNQGDGTWLQSFGFLNGNSDMLVEFGDLNNDGFLDFVSGHEYGTAYFGDGTGNYVNNDNGLPVLPAYDTRNGISMGDVNNDGAKDLAFVNGSSGVEVWKWEETFNTWTSLSGSLPASGSYDFTDLADMNSDGFTDLLAMAGENISIWLGDGQGNWALNTTFSLGEDAGAEAFRAGGDLDHNGFPDMVLLAETGPWYNSQNHLYCYRESSPADSLWIRFLAPNGNERYYPGSVRFIEWISEVPGGSGSSVMLELSAFGPEGPWWLLAAGLPDNGKHQWTIPETGSDNVFLKITVSDGFTTASDITAMPLTIFGLPTKVRNNDPGASQQVILFPNPGNDLINIRSTSPIGELRIYDRFGACVVQSKHPSGQINSGNIQNGTYFYEAVLDNGIRKTGKWIKISDQ